MEKNIGFNRNIKLVWLDTTAAFCTDTSDNAEIRTRLEPIIRQDISSPTNIRKSIDILINIWLKSAETVPELRTIALKNFQETTYPGDRLWLHYGMTLATYPFFYNVVSIIGRTSRYEEIVSTADVRQQVYAEMGELGSIREAVSRVINSLQDWGILLESPKRNVYVPQRRAFTASNKEIETWLLACASYAAPGEEMPVPDLLNLSALFPFQLSVIISDLRQSTAFKISRQGMGLNMIQIVHP